MSLLKFRRSLNFLKLLFHGFNLFLSTPKDFFSFFSVAIKIIIFLILSSYSISSLLQSNQSGRSYTRRILKLKKKKKKKKKGQGNLKKKKKQTNKSSYIKTTNCNSFTTAICFTSYLLLPHKRYSFTTAICFTSDLLLPHDGYSC